MSVSAIMGRSIALLSFAFIVSGCPADIEQSPPVCTNNPGSLNYSIQMVPANGGQNVFATFPAVVDPTLDYAFEYDSNAVSATGQTIGIRQITVAVQGLSDCTGPQGTQRVETPQTVLYSVDYPPFGQPQGVLLQPFNYSKIACPVGTVATAGTLFFGGYLGTYCEHLWDGHICTGLRVIAGKQLGVTYTGCVHSLIPDPDA
jgi:hypothetical protein